MAVQTSERLQEIANRKQDIAQAADHCIEPPESDTLDSLECSDIVDFQASGIATGLRLARLLGSKANVEIFEVKFSEYDYDKLAYFVGTEDEIAAKLETLPDKDED